MDQLIPLNLPPKVPLQRERAPQKNIPQTREERVRLRDFIREYVKASAPVPPLSEEELLTHTEKVLEESGTPPLYRDYVAVLFSNEVWRESLASIPFERRLLLLPKCLRVEDRCPAPFDEFGLLCKKCGLCTIQDLQSEAERLGYAVLVAEGSAVVMAIIETGKIDAVIGVSCLSVLEKAFPHMEAAAVPGIAIPLLQDDCRDTNVDLEWVWDVIHLTSQDRTRRLDLDGLRQEVESWFSPEALDEIMGPAEGSTDRLARDWLSRAGKRWRPFLTVCAFQSFQEDPGAPPPDRLKRIAVAVECFHKASLVHDDIEDQDSLRYGRETLHEEQGVPVALNVGDLLVGEGYRLIAESEAPAETKARLLQVAASGHRSLCLGQGAELAWARTPEPLSLRQVLEIFRRKTSPAFQVALSMGALFAEAGPEVLPVLERYSESLGIAYQIRDDLKDSAEGAESDDVSAARLSLLLAIAHEKARGKRQEQVASWWMRPHRLNGDAEAAREMYRELGVELRAEEILESYKEDAIRSLMKLDNANLKGLLRRVVGKIFGDLEIKGWCGEFEARNAAGGAAGADSAA